MPRIIVFDVNETLLNFQALAPRFTKWFPETNALQEWFSLLLLHSQTVTLSGLWFDFATLAGAALDMLAASRSIGIPERDKASFLRQMLSLPAHPDAGYCLELLLSNGFRLVTLTNSSRVAVEQQIRNAGLAEFFERNYSVEEVRRYKPAPEPYRMVAGDFGVETSDLRMVAAHAWDIVGAMQAGCAGAFVARPGKVLFPLAPAPDIIGQNLREVAHLIVAREARSAA